MLKVTELDGTRHRISTNSRLSFRDPLAHEEEWGVGAVVRVEGCPPLMVRERFEDIERQLDVTNQEV